MPARVILVFLVFAFSPLLDFSQAQSSLDPSKFQWTGPGETRRLIAPHSKARPSISPTDLVEIHQIEDNLWDITAKKSGNGIFQWVGAESKSEPIQIGTQLHDAPPSFLREVLPLMTRAGCNQGACHGKGAGQNGFRLSLRGYAPELDHAWIAKEFMGRRMDKNAPAESPFLKKALGLAPHDGGRRIQPGSRAQKLLERWIEADLPGPNPKEAPLVRLELQPNLALLPTGQTTGLVAIAHYKDGTKQDVSWLTKFESNDPGLVSCSANGLVRSERPGETIIRAAFGSLVATATIRTPYPANNQALAQSNIIHPLDQAWKKQWQELRLLPSALCDDATFLRRACLDATGLLPTEQQSAAFLADKRPNKREILIDQLLQGPAFVDRWTLFLADLLQNRKERDHDVRGLQGVRQFHAWLRTKVQADTPWDQLTREVLTAQGESDASPAIGYFIVTVGEHQDATRSEVAASVAQAFLGTRIGCAQCHNHPLERYTQNDYYHFAGYFSRIKLERKEPNQGTTKLVALKPDTKAGTNQPRTGQFLEPQPLDRTATPVANDQDPRTALAQWMTGPARDDLAGAMANRIWRELLGRGLVEPVDDLRATNPPVNPEVWNLLVKEFLKKDLKIRELVRFIMTSEVYQRSSFTTEQNAQDHKFFTHYTVRRLPAEQLLDAVSFVTGVPEQFPGYPKGLRAQQIPDPTFPSYFLKVFGRSERVTACACEREGEVTLPQLLHLRNNTEIQARIRNPISKLGQSLSAKMPPVEIARQLHQLALGRPMGAATEDLLKKDLAQAPADEVLADFVWALLNSKEFSFNH